MWVNFYARADSKIAHYKCAKKRDWKRGRKKKKSEHAVLTFTRTIKVVRDGKVIKRMSQTL